MAQGAFIRLATPEDTPKVLEVLSELFPDTDLLKRHEWLYEKNPHGRAITWLAIDDETKLVAGVTSFFPRKLTVDGGLVTAALGGDGFVRPRFRRRGIMQQMHKRSREDMPRFGIEVMYGTPMPANFTPLAVAGSKDVTQVARYVRPLDASTLKVPGKLLGRAVRAVLTPRALAYLDPATISDTRVDDVWGEAKKDFGITTVRDSAYFTWRYVLSPSQRQNAFVILQGSTPIGTCALERDGDRVRIIDLVATREKYGACLRAIGAYSAGSSALEIRVSTDNAKQLAFWRRGFLLRDKEPRPLNIVLPPGDPRASVYHDGAKWYVTWTETDRDSS